MPVLPATHKPRRAETPKHRPPQAQEQWGSGRGGRPWRRKRQRVFERDKYLCQQCQREGKVTAVALSGPTSGRCDHIIPRAEGGTDDEDNLETLCQPCHNMKTARESVRGANRQRVGAVPNLSAFR